MASNTLTCFGEKVAKERRDSVPEAGHKIQHFQQAKLLGLMLRPPEQVKERKRDFPGFPGGPRVKTPRFHSRQARCDHKIKKKKKIKGGKEMFVVSLLKF